MAFPRVGGLVVLTFWAKGRAMPSPIRWIAAFDLHGVHADPSTLRAWWSFVSLWKPALRVVGGDVFDFSHLRAKASEAERYESGQLDFQIGLDFLRRYKPTHVTWGNHDARAFDLLRHPNGNIRDQGQAIVDEMTDAVKGAKSVLPHDKRKYLTIGNLKIIHGFSHGENAVRKAANAYGRVLMGHLHRIESVRVDAVEVREGYACGCLCKVDLDYNARNLGTLRHENGWAYGEVLPSGHTTVHLARRVGGVWHLPTEFVSLKETL